MKSKTTVVFVIITSFIGLLTISSQAQTPQKNIQLGMGVGYVYHSGFNWNVMVKKWYGGITITSHVTDAQQYGLISVAKDHVLASFEVGHAIIPHLYGIFMLSNIFVNTNAGIGNEVNVTLDSQSKRYGVGGALMYEMPFSKNFGIQLFAGYGMLKTYLVGIDLVIGIWK